MLKILRPDNIMLSSTHVSAKNLTALVTEDCTQKSAWLGTLIEDDVKHGELYLFTVYSDYFAEEGMPESYTDFIKLIPSNSVNQVLRWTKEGFCNFFVKSHTFVDLQKTAAEY